MNTTIRFLFIFLLPASIVLGQSDYNTILKNYKSKIFKSTDLEEFNDILLKFDSVILSQWYGTSWDYNGYTNKPKNGFIACGYFVSTCLKHIGFNWNRYDLAKLYSKDVVIQLSNNKYSTFTDLESLALHINRNKDQLYVLGLSNHIGFVLRKNNKTYFIHSDYLNGVEVHKELLIESQAAHASDKFWLTSISLNEYVKTKFLNKTEWQFSKT